MSGAQFQMLLMRGTGQVQLTFLDFKNSTVTSGSFSFTNTDCGPGGDIVLVAEIFSSGNFGPLTIGGVTATQEVVADLGGTGSNIAIYTASGVPSGLQTVAFTISGGSGLSTRTGIQVYSIEGQGSLTPADTDTDTTHTTGDQSGTLNVPPGGAILAGAMQNTGTASDVTWSGATEDVHDQPSAADFTTAHEIVPGGDSAYAISCTFTGTVVAGAGVFAAWAPPA